MTPVSSELEDLLAFALYDVDEGVRQGEQPLYWFMVSTALYGGALTGAGVCEAVRGQLAVDSAVKQDQVDEAVVRGLQLKLLVRQQDGRLALSEVRRHQLDEARGRVAAQRAAFHDHMLAKVSRGGEVTVDADQLRDRLEAELQSVFQQQSVSLAAAWVADNTLDQAVDRLNVEDRMRSIASALSPGGAQKSKIGRSVIADGLEQGLLSLPDAGRAYLASLFHRTVALAMLEQDPTVRQVKHRAAARRVAYLDTNVLLRWMFIADELHPLACQVIELTRAVGAELRVSQFTLRELSHKLNEADAFMKRYRSDPRLLRVADDVAVRSFVRAQRELPHLQWSGFIGKLLPPTEWLESKGVGVDAAESVAPVKNDPRRREIRAALKRIKQQADDLVIATDASNMMLVARLRDQLAADEMGSRVWLVTLDGALGRADRDLIRSRLLSSGLSKQAQDWCDLLAPCVPPDAEQLAGYVTFAVQSQFGLLSEDPTFVDTSFLEILSRNGFDLGGLLDTNEAVVCQVLARLQTDQELRELLGNPDVGDAQWNDQLEKSVMRTLEKLKLEALSEQEVRAAQGALVVAEQLAEDERKGRVVVVRELAQTKRRLAENEAALEAERRRAELAERELAERDRRSWIARLFGR